MKILLVSSSSGSRGGGEKFLLRMAQGLVRRGNEVILWASDHGRMDELCEQFSEYGQVVRSGYRNTYDYATRPLATLWNEGEVRRIAAEWDALGVDVVHVNKQNLEDGLDLLRAATRCRAASVCTIHLPQGAVVFGAKFGWLRDWVSIYGLKRYRGQYVTVLESRSEELRKFVLDPAQVRTIENGVDSFDFSRKESWRAQVRQDLGWSEEHLVFCCVARMVDQKRPQVFLDLALEYLKQNRQARFLWVGDGALAPQWDERVGKAGMGEFIRRLPWQTEVCPYFAGADIYLHTAAYEGCPYSLIEAMGAGLPCVVSRDLLETMPIFAGGRLAAVESGCGLAAVDFAIETRREMAAWGRSVVEDRFSLEVMAERYEEVYRQAALMPRL